MTFRSGPTGKVLKRSIDLSSVSLKGQPASPRRGWPT